MNCCDFNPIVKQSEEGAIYTKKLRFIKLFPFWDTFGDI